MELFISSTAINSKDINECVKNLAEIGVKNIELSGGTEYKFFNVDKLLEIKDEYSLKYLTHNYFPPPPEPFVLNLASKVRNNREMSINFCKSSIDLSKKLGVDRYVAHAGYAEELSASLDTKRMFTADGKTLLNLDLSVSNMHQSVESICTYALDKNVKFGLENLFPFGKNKNESLLSTPESIFSYLELSKNINGGFLLDLGHLVVSANYFGFDKELFIEELLDQYGDRILEVHISGNDGVYDLHSPLNKMDWQVTILDKLSHLDVPIAIEVRSIDNSKILEQISLINSFL